NAGWEFDYSGELSFLYVVAATRNYAVLPGTGDNIFDHQYKLLIAPLISNEIVLSIFSTVILRDLLATEDIASLADPVDSGVVDTYNTRYRLLSENLKRLTADSLLAQLIDDASLVLAQTKKALDISKTVPAVQLSTSASDRAGFGSVLDLSSDSHAYIITPENDQHFVRNHDITGATPSALDHDELHYYLGNGEWGEREIGLTLIDSAGDGLPKFQNPEGQVFNVTLLSSLDISGVNIFEHNHLISFLDAAQFASKNPTLTFSAGAQVASVTLTTEGDGYHLRHLKPSGGHCFSGPDGNTIVLGPDETNCARTPTLHYSADTQTFQFGSVSSLDDITYSSDALETEDAALVMLLDWGGNDQDLYAQFIDTGTE